MNELDCMDLASLKSLAEQCKIEITNNTTKLYKNIKTFFIIIQLSQLECLMKYSGPPV